MRILHTSDWHLGRKLCGQDRSEEFESFLAWLGRLIQTEKVDALLVAGDIFDSCTPPLWAQTLYYHFLTGLAETCCSSVVITSGNHDSAALLDSSRDLLRRLNVFVVGQKREAPEEVFELPDSSGAVGAVCCAVPFLRSRDLCGSMAGEDSAALRSAELKGFAAHYAAVCDAAESVRAGRSIPLIALGHCFVAGGQVNDDDGVRELCVGELNSVPANAFPPSIDYLALGHLHMAQTCGKSDMMRYSGAPLCMGFGEAGRKKSVYLLETSGRSVIATAVPVPEFQKIVRVKGSFEEIAAKMAELAFSSEPLWGEADCSDAGTQGLNERIRDLAPEGGPVKLLRVKVAGTGLASSFSGEGDLNEDWSPKEVFRLYLEENNVTGEEAEALMGAYLEALESLREGEE